jgi:hypothetical protein
MLTKEVEVRNHLLLDKAYVYPTTRLPTTPADCHYDYERGYWVNNETLQPFVAMDDHQALMTKKKDVETGEDEKGE